MKKRILAILMALCMVMTVMPTALAEGDAEPQAEATLQSMINAAKSGDTITLDKDYTESITIDKNQEITLDLGRWTLTNEAGQHTITNKGTLTIIGDGTVDNVSNNRGAVCNYPNAEVTLSGGTYTRSRETGEVKSGQNSWYTLKNYGTMIIEDGVTVNQGPEGDSAYSSLVANGYQNDNDRNSITKGYDNPGTPTMTITGGDFIGGLNTIKNDDYGVLEITGGNFENVAQHAVMNWNVATIVDGNFESAGSAVVWNGYNNTATDMNQGQLTIKGGTFTAPSNMYAIYEGYTGGTVSITGGTFEGGALTNAANAYGDGEGAIIQKDGSFTVGATEGLPTDSNGNYYADEDTAAQDNVAMIGSVCYPTLQAAVNAVTDSSDTTIELLGDKSGNGVVVPSGKNITFDFKGYTYTIDGTTVGSTGTETNGFQLKKDSTITFKNGTLTSPKAIILIQNYSDLTLENMDLDGTQTNWYVLSNNNGNTNITGNTSITAAEGCVAFDICWAPDAYPDGAHVTVDTTGTITGIIEVGEWTPGQDNTNFGSDLEIQNVTLIGEIVPTSALTEIAKEKIEISGGEFSSSVADYVVSSIPVELNNNGTYTYHETVEDALAAAEEGAVITDTSDPTADPIAVVTVTFEGAKEKPITVLPGTTITLPTPDDTRDEIFRYWTVAGDPIGTRYYGGEEFTAGEDVTFVANWKDNSYIPVPPTQPTKPTKPTKPDEPDEPDETEEPVESELPFTDVDVDDTFYEAVKYVSENGLMTGVEENVFAPYGAFTRAQIATVLYRLEKEPAVEFAATFPDVLENQWFAKAVLWGNSKGILLGHDTGKFGPDDGVTLEQMLTILYRYAALKGYDTAARTDVTGFECSDYAAEAVSWAAAHGLVGSADATALKAPAARCQVAQVLAAFCQTVVIK